jgi:hypothetical protein
VPTGNVTFTRQCLNQKEFPNWSKLDVSLRDLHVSSEGTIEDDGVGFLRIIRLLVERHVYQQTIVPVS